MIPYDQNPQIFSGSPELLDQLTKRWLSQKWDDSLPDGWEVRFGLRGRFLKYDSVEHAEQKNDSFGNASTQWEKLKNNLQEGDEIWRHGNDNGEFIYLIRNGQLVTEEVGGCGAKSFCGGSWVKIEQPKHGYYVTLVSWA